MKHIIAVLNPEQRDEVVHKLHTNYSIRYTNSTKYIVVKNRINQITIYEKPDHIIHTVTVVVVPVMLDHRSLENMRDMDAKFSLGILFQELDRLRVLLKDLVDNPAPTSAERAKASIIHHTIMETCKDGETNEGEVWS